jgi:hypothetical protein
MAGVRQELATTIGAALPLARPLARLNRSGYRTFPEGVICVPSASLALFGMSPRLSEALEKLPDLLARSEGFEPPTPRFEVLLPYPR